MDKQTAQSDADILATVTKNFEEAENASRDSREEAETARDYFDGIQWTAEEINTLRARKQPVITDNKIKDKVEYIIGLEAASRSDPKAYPRTPQEEDSAEAATDALRFVADANDLPTVFSDVAENKFIEGFGGLEVVIEDKGGEPTICVRRIPWDRMYYDPHSVAKDFSDARFLGSFVWMDLDDAQDKWPDVAWSATESATQDTETYADKPKCKWYDSARRRVRVVEQWYKKGGDWYHCKFIKGEFVESPSKSPYLNDMGETEHTYCFMSAYVDRDGNRYGVFRRYKDLQDEINHRRSRSLFILNVCQLIAERGAFDDINKARQEASKPDGVLEYNQGFEVRLEKNTDLSVGQAQLLADVTEALAVTGPKAVSNSSASQSGRARQLESQTDMLQVGRLFDQLRALKRQTYIKIWNRVQQFWTQEKWIRVRDDEGRLQFAQLNAPVTALQRAQEALQNGDPNAEQYIYEAQQDPNAVVDVKNNVRQLHVDIIIDEAPDILTIQQEQFAELVSLAGAGVVFPPEVYIEASSLRNKDALREKLTGGDDPQAQQMAAMQQEMAQMAAQIEIMQGKAKADADSAKARKDNADAEQQELINKLGLSAVTELATG